MYDDQDHPSPSPIVAIVFLLSLAMLCALVFGALVAIV